MAGRTLCPSRFGVTPRTARETRPDRSGTRLAALTPGSIDTFFYANSGAEITEGAVKLAKQVTGRPHVIVFSGSFHGRTHMAMAMTTSKTSYRAGHSPLPSGVFVAPFPDPLAADQDAEAEAALAGVRHLLASLTAPEETAAMSVDLPALGNPTRPTSASNFNSSRSHRSSPCVPSS